MTMSGSSWGLDLKIFLEGQRNLKALHQTVILQLFPSPQLGINNCYKLKILGRHRGFFRLLQNTLDELLRSWYQILLQDQNQRYPTTVQQEDQKLFSKVDLKTCPLESRAPQHSPNLHGNGVHRGPTKITHS